MKTMGQLVAITTVPLLLACLCGCAIPVPRTRNIAMAGPGTTIRPKVDEIRVGVTSRAEWQRKLGGFDTNASGGNFFWARWAEAMLPYEWYSRAGTERDWRLVNVLALFDSGGVVRRYCVCSERNLVECLYLFAALEPAPAAFGAPLTFKAHRWALAYGTDRFHGDISFDEGGAVLMGHAGAIFRPTGPINLEVAWRGIDRIRVRLGSTSDTLRLTIHFQPVVSRVDYVSIDASPGATWQLIRKLRVANAQHH